MKLKFGKLKGGSLDRLKRVMGIMRGNLCKQEASRIQDALHDARVDGLHVDAAVATLVTMAGRTVMVLIAVDCLDAPSGHRSSMLSADELADKRSRVTGRVMLLKEPTITSETLVWRSGALSSESVEVPGPLVKPLDPDVAPGDDARYIFDAADLDAVAMVLRAIQRTTWVDFKLPDIAGMGVPYKRGGKDSFVVNTEIVTTTEAHKTEKLKCEFCPKLLLRANMRAHIGHHILGGGSDFTCTEPCGFCGVAESASCNTRITGTGSNLKLETDCRAAPRFSLAAARKVSKPQPCTNLPVACAHPTCRLFVWKYNITAHWESKHKEETMPLKMKTAAAVTEKEKKWVMKLAESGRIPADWK
jgi:hypothetical protein